MLNLACLISFFRIILAFVTVYLLYQAQYETALYSFLIAAFTDVLDGLVARVCNQQTQFGQILDPVADKIYAISVMSALWWIEYLPILQSILLFLLIKEFILLAAGAWLWFVQHRFIQPSKLSRKASFFEFGFIGALLLGWAGCMIYTLVLFFSVGSIFYSVILLISYARLLLAK